MTARAGSYLPNLINNFCDGTRGGRAGSVIVTAQVIGSNPPIYKNTGFFSGTAESWMTVGFKGGSVNPITGHSLTDVSHIVLSGSE